MVHDINHLENVTFQIEAHSESAITCMISDPSNSKFFTSGLDNSIKVWHVYPFAVEPLSKILSFFCGLLPSNLVNIGNFLFTVFHDSERAQYPSVVYDIDTRGRHDHSPTDDHVEPVNSVSACARMKLFLSCSSGSENVIKIWTCRNVLLRQIEMHFPIFHAVFSSERADIFAAVGQQICLIDSKKYLPTAYIKKQVLMHFENLSEGEDASVAFDEDLSQKNFNLEDQEKMQGIKSVFRYQSYIDILSKEETDRISKINEERKNNFDKLKAVEDDIASIQHGEYQKPRSKYERFLKKPLKSDIFDAYFSQIVTYNKIPIPISGQEDDLEDKLKRQQLKKYTKPIKEGFFPPRESMNKMMAPNNIRRGGYIPNSSILQRLWSPKAIKEKADTWKPPVLSSLDIATQESDNPPVVEEVQDDDDETGSKFFDWDSDEEQVKNSLIVPEESTSETLSGDLLNKFGSLLETKAPVKEEKPVEKQLESTDKKETMKRPVTTTKTLMKLPEITRKPKTMPDMRKVRFTPSPEKSSLLITEVPDQDPTILEHVSILPDFLSQFDKEDWFLKICPLPHHDRNCLKQLPSPLNASSFGLCVVKLIENTNDPEDVLGMVNTVKILYSHGDIDITNRSHISSVIEEKLNNLSALDSDIKLSLLKSCLDLLASLRWTLDKTIVVVCLSRFFDADLELKSFLKSILYRIGLEDNTDVIGNELATFKLSSIRPGPERGGDLVKLVSDWLERQFQSMGFFAAKCQDVIGKEIHLMETQNGKPSDATLEHLESIKSIFHLQIKCSADLVALDPVEKNPKSILNYVNSLNFFRFNKLGKTILQKLSSGEGKSGAVGTRKTIVSLPKLKPERQCLVRIGESNALASLQVKSKKDYLNLVIFYFW